MKGVPLASPCTSRYTTWHRLVMAYARSPSTVGGDMKPTPRQSAHFTASNFGAVRRRIMKSRADHESDCRRIAVTVRGVVQGVGFRPFVYNTARAAGLTGFVRNDADRVHIEVEGPRKIVENFVERLKNHPPRQAEIETVDVAAIACHNDWPSEFHIEASHDAAAPQPTIPADLATCPECLTEIRDPKQRRYGYPFTNCTQCGPRWSIIEGLPYDRPRTSMRAFTMCPDCRREYEAPADRRFHAQPIACPRCGPRLCLLGPLGDELAIDNEALLAAAAEIMAGRIVALKGLGGFQLLCDATSDAAVTRLRQRKRRPARPLAVMAATLDDVQIWCRVSEVEAATLQSPQAPILLLRKSGGPGLAEAVAPGNPYLGAMLPYTPLHHLLMDAVERPVVCTSGNLSEEPMVTTTGEALARLGPIADCLLTHNRPIVRPVDDSVARILDGQLQLLRRARGYAPRPVAIPSDGHVSVLAMGGHLKNTVALALPTASPTTGGKPAKSRPAILSSHVGDLESVLSLEVHRRAAADLTAFFHAKPAKVACDLHPDYASTREAESLARQWDVPLVRVQHHHAHVAACMAEHGLEGPVLGISWDGTGYGPDGTVWGGEMLQCDRAEFVRVAHLRPFPLPGGDRAAREPRRSALGLLFAAWGRDAKELALQWFTHQELRILLDALELQLNSPRTSSMGRIFDAVAAIVGLPQIVTFEGQAAMALEFAADSTEAGVYPLPLAEGVPAIADWQPMLEALLADLRVGVSVSTVSGRFHNALAGLAVAAAERVGCHRVVISGGCFQNGVLSILARQQLEHAGFEVFSHHRVPPGDGGIALGQLYVATKGGSSAEAEERNNATRS